LLTAELYFNVRTEKGNQFMSTNPQPAIQAAQTAANETPENVPLRESSVPGAVDNGRIVEVAFRPVNTRFRESSAKPSRKRPNAERRSREFLTPAEVQKLVEAAQRVGRHGHRDATMITVTYRHALRVSELVALRWDQVDLAQGLLHVRRRKNGNPSTHPLHGPELRALRRLQRDYPKSSYIFSTERRGPLTDSTVRKMVARAGAAAGLEFPVHPHMLRHAAGYKLANDGQDTRAIQHYLGHKNISHTVRYTELSPERFKDFWQD
jgi:type 1 fimbriae regulatory protein FimB/type 1 fimbriae regulatory protein FimE